MCVCVCAFPAVRHRHQEVDWCAMGREAVGQNGLLHGGPTQSFWTTRVLPALKGNFEGTKIKPSGGSICYHNNVSLQFGGHRRTERERERERERHRLTNHLSFPHYCLKKKRIQCTPSLLLLGTYQDRLAGPPPETDAWLFDLFHEGAGSMRLINAVHRYFEKSEDTSRCLLDPASPSIDSPILGKKKDSVFVLKYFPFFSNKLTKREISIICFMYDGFIP